MITAQFAVQLSTNSWVVTFVSEAGFSETKTLSNREFVAMILAQEQFDDLVERPPERPIKFN